MPDSGRQGLPDLVQNPELRAERLERTPSSRQAGQRTSLDKSPLSVGGNLRRSLLARAKPQFSDSDLKLGGKGEDVFAQIGFRDGGGDRLGRGGSVGDDGDAWRFGNGCGGGGRGDQARWWSRRIWSRHVLDSGKFIISLLRGLRLDRVCRRVNAELPGDSHLLGMLALPAQLTALTAPLAFGLHADSKKNQEGYRHASREFMFVP